MMTLSAEGALFIKREEEEGGKPRLKSYDDGTGTWTIAWGCTEGVREGMEITEAEAEHLFNDEIEGKVEEANKLIKRPVSQGLFDALVSFGYNDGFGNCKRLISAINAGDNAKIRATWALYDHARDERTGKTVVWPGLVKRRADELAYWARRDAEIVPHEAQASPPAIIKPKSIPHVAASSPSLWALLNAKVMIVFGMLTSGFRGAWDWGTQALGVVPDVENDVQGVLSHGQTFAGWLALPWEKVAFGVAVVCIGVAFARHLHDKMQQP